MENYIIYVENSIIGTKLSLGKNNVFKKGYNRWAVEDNFNGLSVPTEIYKVEKLGRISDYVYGFYKKDMSVTLHLYGKNNRILKTIENVKILDKREAGLSV